MKLIALVVIFAVSVSAWIRSRLRVRKLMNEPILEAPQCTIDRANVRRFFQDTLMFRAAVEGRIDGGSRAVLSADDLMDMQQQVGAFRTAHQEWRDMFTRELDEQDREALEERGITKGRIEALEELADAANPKRLQRLLTELTDFEQRMKAPPRTTAYR